MRVNSHYVYLMEARKRQLIRTSRQHTEMVRMCILKMYGGPVEPGRWILLTHRFIFNIYRRSRMQFRDFLYSTPGWDGLSLFVGVHSVDRGVHAYFAEVLSTLVGRLHIQEDVLERKVGYLYDVLPLHGGTIGWPGFLDGWMVRALKILSDPVALL